MYVMTAVCGLVYDWFSRSTVRVWCAEYFAEKLGTCTTLLCFVLAQVRNALGELCEQRTPYHAQLTGS